MKKILLATPVKGGCSINYIKSIIVLHFSKANKIFGGPDAPYDFRWGATAGTSVNLARDELACLAIKGGFDGILWQDKDLGSYDDQTMLDMYMRLLSHSQRGVEGIVAGQYVGHKFISEFHGAVEHAGKMPDQFGLLEMAQMPVGFCYMPMKDLLKIKAASPWRRYYFRETGMEKGKEMHEFFPIGIAGPCSSEGKMERLRTLFKESGNGAEPRDLLKKVCAIVDDNHYETNIQLGEDYYFCKLAREAGVKLYLDNNLIVPHTSEIRLPVNNQDILSAVGEEWRLHNDAKPEQVKELVEKLRPLLSMDIP